ncbi:MULTISPECIES: ClpXP protease specificity-enhancing factor [Legionella]|uniref:ClpXP protease specificity-enhancing factor n=1 Tax=Legionella septentrionalis TaxID=2498109 RepID=A0A3S0XHH2_9GAMM|nr:MULTISPECIES: ClpXP protease specificity-enhancing factor [Legionella]MCP0914573.1 ClpXP protease specificity-enhancing factor [Legionella sp. 27cVA30]RUQ90084.1 ClpXP protease specificity-enhancing factor [Legionella septentrionalis]RUQ95514.1 ClpXP protease specificity-enhancing factor [Legionella septentrionalis]RUR11290.1 ClpXP protease specificity-enhancing factor [Legionella septentrionalis]RUR14391.1 ClpXP protease specificity-enhancing factor [Legionella septentrionalis]
MTSNKPYLIRAIYDWIIDHDLTPYLLVNADAASVQVPQEYVDGGRIVLNISPKACRGLHLENDKILFTARFSGIATQICLPPSAVLAIYAKENGRGMEFAEDDEGGTTPPPASNSEKGTGKPKLKLVK